jgi:tetratricopeptide (TPR) repeat protein
MKALLRLMLLIVAVPAAGQPPPTFDTLAKQAAKARAENRLEEAVTLYRQALARKPGWIEGRWYVGSMLYELDRHAEARDEFAKLLARQPNHAAATGLKGLCEFGLGRHEEALRSLLRARTLGIAGTPGIEAVVRYHTGILLTVSGEFEAGQAVLTEFASEPVPRPQVIEAMGLNLLRMRVLPAAIDPANRAMIRLAGEAAFAIASRRRTEAGPILDTLVARYGTTPNVHYARGVFRLTEAPDTAIADFGREIEVSPNHVPARLQIVFELLKRGDASGALPYARAAAALDAEFFAARLALGQVLLDLGEIDAAIPELERAATLAPGSPQPPFLLARAYTRAGRPADAARAREQFARLDRLVRAQRGGTSAVGGIPSKP